MRATLIAVAWLTPGMNPVLAQHGGQAAANAPTGANPPCRRMATSSACPIARSSPPRSR